MVATNPEQSFPTSQKHLCKTWYMCRSKSNLWLLSSSSTTLPKQKGVVGGSGVIPAPGEKELESLMLLSGWSCALMLFPAIWPLCSLREVPTVIAVCSWITLNHVTWNPPRLMVRSHQIYQIQPVVHNSKFQLSHEEIYWFSSLHCSLLFNNSFSGRGYEFSFWESWGNVKHFFFPQANSTLLVFGWK